MAKKPKPTPHEPTADTAAPSLLPLDTLREMATEQRVDLYVQTENRQRLGFLLQGKILHTLGTEGTELLRAAGIKPSSLSNARKAEWVLRAFSAPDTDTLRNARFHYDGADEPVPFSEALYNTLTLRQCELLQLGFTSLGTVRHRPGPRQMSEMLVKPNWDDHIECFLECGVDLDGKAERDAQAARQLEEERVRREQMEQQIAEQAAQIAAMQAAGASLPPPPPVVNTAPATTTAEDESDTTPANVVAFPGTPAEDDTDPQTTAEAEDEPVETTEDEPEHIEDEPEHTQDEPEDVTHEEIAEAIADATSGMEAYIEDGPTTLHNMVGAIEDALNDGAVNQCSVEDLNSLLVRLDDITAALRSALAAKAAPQDDLPEQSAPKAKGKRGKKALVDA